MFHLNVERQLAIGLLKSLLACNDLRHCLLFLLQSLNVVDRRLQYVAFLVLQITTTCHTALSN